MRQGRFQIRFLHSYLFFKGGKAGEFPISFKLPYEITLEPPTEPLLWEDALLEKGEENFS